MTAIQHELIDALAALRIEAEFSGQHLTACVVITGSKGKKTVRKRQRFTITFDHAPELDGPRAHTFRGAYSEAFARDAMREIVRVRDGEEAAVALDG